MCSVVVIDDVPSMVRACYVYWIGNGSSSIHGVPKTQNTIHLVCCVRYIDRKSKEASGMAVAFI